MKYSFVPTVHSNVVGRHHDDIRLTLSQAHIPTFLLDGLPITCDPGHIVHPGPPPMLGREQMTATLRFISAGATRVNRELNLTFSQFPARFALRGVSFRFRKSASGRERHISAPPNFRPSPLR